MGEFLKLGLSILYILFFSFLAGNLVLHKLQLSDKFIFKISIGFYVFLGIFQLIIYPVQYFHLDSKFLVWGMFLVSAFLLVWAIKGYKIFLNTRTDYRKIVGILLITFICTALYYFTSNFELICDSYALDSANNDFYFYIRMISENSKPNTGINSTDIINGNQMIATSPLYAFTGIIHFFSVFVALFNLRAISFVVWNCFILLRIFSLMNMFNIISLLNFKGNVKHIYILTVIFSLFIGFGFVSGFYPVNFRWLSGMTSVLIICLLYFFKERKKQWIYLYSILSLGLLSTQSTQLFISAVLFAAAAVYDAAVNKRFDIQFLSIIGFPFIIYAGIFISYSIHSLGILVMLFLIFAGINMIYYCNKKIFHYKIILFVSIFSLTGMVLYGFINKNAVYSLSESINYFSQFISFDFFDSEIVTSKFDILGNIAQRILFILPFYNLVRYKNNSYEVNFCSIFMACTILLFYNPFVMPFISTFMTNIVYHRLELLIINSVYYFVFIRIFVEKYPKFGKMMFVSSLLSMITFLQFNYGNFEHYPLYKTIADPKYKISNEIINMSNFLDDYFCDEEVTVLYPITIANLRLFNERFNTSELVPDWYQNTYYHDDFIYQYNELDDLMKLQCLLLMPVDYFTNYYYEFEPDRVPDLKEILLESDADVVIMKKWEDNFGEDKRYHELLEQFTEIIYDNNIYQIYRIYR